VIGGSGGKSLREKSISGEKVRKAKKKIGQEIFLKKQRGVVAHSSWPRRGGAGEKFLRYIQAKEGKDRLINQKICKARAAGIRWLKRYVRFQAYPVRAALKAEGRKGKRCRAQGTEWNGFIRSTGQENLNQGSGRGWAEGLP